jgi:hypothetical protein
MDDRDHPGGVAEQQGCAEAEVKVEVSRCEFARFPGVLGALGFVASSTVEITDYYLVSRQSPHGGWDFERLRRERQRGWWLTEKQWAITADKKRVRIEREERLPRVEGIRLAKKIGEDSVLRKTRRGFSGQIEGLRVVVSLDEVQLGGPPRFFLECEARTPPARYSEACTLIWMWLRSKLMLTDRPESPSMLELLAARQANNVQQRR